MFFLFAFYWWIGMGFVILPKRKEIWNVALLSFAFVLIGYASYFLVLVRSNFNPPINENDPNDVISYVSYLKREQYRNRPLFGPVFTGRPINSERGEPIYRKSNGRYIIADYRPNMSMRKISKCSFHGYTAINRTIRNYIAINWAWLKVKSQRWAITFRFLLAPVGAYVLALLFVGCRPRER
ncbi:MAG: hypothetical protein R2822_29000 [Spirosomataceae bacterium]